MPFFSRLFGKSAPAAKAVEPVLYKDCRIFPEPIKEPGGYRVAARIEKTIGGTVQAHAFQRADRMADPDEATEISIAKAKLAIDQLGDSLFAKG